MKSSASSKGLPSLQEYLCFKQCSLWHILLQYNAVSHFEQGVSETVVVRHWAQKLDINWGPTDSGVCVSSVPATSDMSGIFVWFWLAL
jgi:hypothetical protein